jgi:hypothetical protein
MRDGAAAANLGDDNVTHTTAMEGPLPMVRTFARTRAFPVLAWAYVIALAVQVFFAGMYVFAGASNIELHRTMAHVIGLLTFLLVGAVLAGRVTEKRLTFGVVGLLVVQGMLVHLNQWFGLEMVAALHPVNALVLTYASVTLAKRANAYWATDSAPAGARTPSLTAEPAAG